MSTCLDDLNVTLNAILAALDGNGGVDAPAISVSSETSAQASASANVYLLNQINVAAVAAAQAMAVAILEVDISVSLAQTTTITNLVLPPVSPTVPPNLTVFPETATGVSDTPRAPETASGTTCQAIYYVIDSLAAFAEFLSKFPAIGYMSANVLAYIIVPAIQAAEFFLQARGINLPKAAVAALQAAVMALAAANLSVKETLTGTALYLVTDRDSVAQTIFCAFFDGADTWTVAELVHDQAAASVGVEIAAILATILTPNVLGAMIYNSGLFDASSVTDTCDFICGI